MTKRTHHKVYPQITLLNLHVALALRTSQGVPGSKPPRGKEADMGKHQLVFLRLLRHPQASKSVTGKRQL